MKNYLKINCRYSFFLFIICFSLLFSHFSLASENTCMVAYGKNSGTIEGDYDFLQVIFIKIPGDMRDPLYVRIFDADCGGKLDERYTAKWDTRTRFRLLGGKGAYSVSGLKKPTPDIKDLFSGDLIADNEFGKDLFLDYQWYNLAHVNPEQGEKIDNHLYFKLVAEGVGGDDGNRFQVKVSSDPQRNIPPANIEIFTFAPTVYLPRKGVFAEMRFFVPEDVRKITVHNFDLAKALIGVNTVFRENLPIKTSGQDQWAESVVMLDETEVGRFCALRFEGGREIPNDGTFYVTDDQDRLLPIQLPVTLRKKNRLPKIKLDFKHLPDCKSVFFDAFNTSDPNRDALTFNWDFGDGTKGNGARIVHQYELPGKYNASLIVEDDSGQVSNSVLKRFSVTVNQLPKAEAGPDIIGAPGEKLSFEGAGSTDSDGNVADYYWDFGDGRRRKGAKIQHAFEQPDLYTVTLRVADNFDGPCNYDVDTCKVMINASPVASAGLDQIASPNETISFSGANSNDSDGKIISYIWDMGDGAEKRGMNISHAYVKPGNYKVNLKITDDSGVRNNNAEDAMKVYVNDPPVADAGADRIASTGESISFDGSGSLDRDGKLIEFIWDFGDGTKETVDCRKSMKKCLKIAHAYENPGKHKLGLTIKDDSTSTSDTAYDDAVVIINFPPVAKAGPDIWETSSEIHFDGTMSADQDGGIIEYSWDFGDGEKGSGPKPVHVYSSPGVYTVRMTVTDDSTSSTDKITDEMTVTINHLPVADAGPDQVGVPGQVFAFNGSGSIDPDGEIKSLHWYFGDGADGKGINVSHSFAESGKYNVLLSVRDNSGHDAAVSFDEAVVLINQPPVAIAKAQTKKLEADKLADSNLVTAPGDKIVFDAGRSYDPDGKIISFQWNFSSSECGVQNTECRMKVSKSRFQLPYKKSGKKSGKKFKILKPGTYTATLTVVDNSGLRNSTAQDKVFIRVNTRPTANAGKNIHTNKRTVTLDGSGSTDADGDLLIYTWDFGDGSLPRKGAKVVHTYPKGGNYPAILTVDDGAGLSNSNSVASIMVKINEAPVAEAGDNRNVCAGKVVIFDGSRSADPEGGLMKYHWNFGDGSTAKVMNPTKIYEKGGVYPVTLTVTDDSGLENGNMSIDKIVVKVSESPVADAGPDQTVCAGAVVQFDGTKSRDIDGLVNSFSWDFGDETMGGGPTPVHVYTKAGTYRVVLRITGDVIGDCNDIDEDEMIVTIHEAPVAEFASLAAAELGKPVLFKATSNKQQVTYTWNFGDGSAEKGEKTEHTYTKSGNYIVTLTAASDSGTNCNQTSTQKRITINEPPVAEAGDNRLLGVNQVVTFDGSLSRDPDGVLSSYTWDFGDGKTGTGVRPRHSYEVAGQYTVVLRVADNTDLANNSASDRLIVTVNDAPKPIITGDRNVCAGKEVLFSGGDSSDSDGKIILYTWNFGDGTNGEGKEVHHTYHSVGKYSLVLETDDGRSVSNSRAQASALITVNDPPVADAGSDQVVSPGKNTGFDGSASLDRDGSIVSYKWDFGDGNQAKGKKATHRFKTPGKYQARLTVTDNTGTKCNTSEDVADIRVNSAPVAKAVAVGLKPGKSGFETYTGGAHDAVVFDATNSNDPDRDPLTYYWNFGDGSTAQGVKVKHSFMKPGQYKVKLRVEDGTGLKSGISQDEIKIRVRRRK